MTKKLRLLHVDVQDIIKIFYTMWNKSLDNVKVIVSIYIYVYVCESSIFVDHIVHT